MSYPCPAFNKLFEEALNSNLTRDFAKDMRGLFEDLKNLVGGSRSTFQAHILIIVGLMFKCYPDDL